MSATDTAAMASNGDSAIRSSIVIGSHFILHCQFSILWQEKGACASCRRMENGELAMENRFDCVSPSCLSRFSGSSMHPAGRVSVQGFELALELEHQRQSDRHFRRGHTKNKEIHHLPVRLRPPGASRHKGQSRRIQHNFERHQYENDVAPNEHANQPQRESVPANNNPYSNGIEAITIHLASGSERARERGSGGAREREIEGARE